MNILFRADSSSTIGTGHIMRDLVLAKQYPHDKIYFATQELEGNLNHKIRESGYEVVNLKRHHIDELDKLIKKLDIDLLIIDHYGIGYDDEKKLKISNPMLKILSLDDTYEEHYCDILLNHNIYADEKRYEGLVPEYCELRCGAKYTLLRDEFYEAKKLPKAKNDKKTILLAMGGSDSANLNIPVLEVLKAFDNIEVHVVTTTANANLEALKAYCNNKRWISLHINSNSMATLMRQSDVGIITPSVTANEAYFMELPFIAIQTADNQTYMAEYLMRNNYIVLNDIHNMKNIFQKFIYPQLVNFVDLTFGEKELILEWRNHPDVRKWMFTQGIIDAKTHLEYIDSLSSKSDRKYFLVKHFHQNIGVIDFAQITPASANIGLYANPDMQGVGKILMEKIIHYGFRQLKVNKLISEVFEENVRAIKLYVKFGFQEIKSDRGVITMELKR